MASQVSPGDKRLVLCDHCPGLSVYCGVQNGGGVGH